MVWERGLYGKLRLIRSGVKRVTADEITRVLRKVGFVKIDQSGSHQKWSSFETGEQTIIPYHKGGYWKVGKLKS